MSEKKQDNLNYSPEELVVESMVEDMGLAKDRNANLLLKNAIIMSLAGYNNEQAQNKNKDR